MFTFIPMLLLNVHISISAYLLFREIYTLQLPSTSQLKYPTELISKLHLSHHVCVIMCSDASYVSSFVTGKVLYIINTKTHHKFCDT